MNLSKQSIGQVNAAGIDVPAASYFELPEKVLQFGTGVLLRGLPDYFIDRANKQGLFNGRIVVVKSTATSGADTFDQQDGLFTQCIRGIEDGKKVEENIINASISRVLSAASDWDAVLKCAANPTLQVVISNTTEVGIVLTKDNIHAAPPESFPGKLLAFLYQRYKTFNGDPARGLVIVPTELIPDNGAKLESIVLELAQQNGLETLFLDWLENSNYFCSSLVDRIVPGKLPAAQQQEIEQQLGLQDDLMIMSEVYRLWAIQSGSEQVKKVLNFAQADAGVVIAPDINIFRELKLRLLNGSHTFSCGLAHLAGFDTVKHAMDDAAFAAYITYLMMQEIAPAIAEGELTLDMAHDFAGKVLDRYRNPYIEHQWLSITLQYSAKMKMRNIPVLLKHYEHAGTVPGHMALGFAAHLLFMRSEKDEAGKYWGEANGKRYAINDDGAAYYHNKWKNFNAEEVVHAFLKDEAHWGIDLSRLIGFEGAVNEQLQRLLTTGALQVLKNSQLATVSA